jgi:HEPN domain-containing protein
MNEISLLSKLLPSTPELDELLRKIREKYNIPSILPENVQLAETLSQERTVEEWEGIRQEIEDGARRISNATIIRF